MYGLHHAVLLSGKIALKEAFSTEEMSQVNYRKAGPKDVLKHAMAHRWETQNIQLLYTNRFSSVSIKRLFADRLQQLISSHAVFKHG